MSTLRRRAYHTPGPRRGTVPQALRAVARNAQGTVRVGQPPQGVPPRSGGSPRLDSPPPEAGGNFPFRRARDDGILPRLPGPWGTATESRHAVWNVEGTIMLACPPRGGAGETGGASALPASGRPSREPPSGGRCNGGPQPSRRPAAPLVRLSSPGPHPSPPPLLPWGPATAGTVPPFLSP